MSITKKHMDWNALAELSVLLGSRDVKFLKTNPNAKIPSPKSIWAAGADLYAVEHQTVLPGQTCAIHTGLKMELPTPYLAVEFTPRSGLAIKQRVTVLNSPGLIDSDYRGELMVILINHGDEAFFVNPGDRVAQMQIKLNLMSLFSFEETTEPLSDTERGEGGLGSTGIQ